MAKVELQVQPWQERGIQVMVLLSFTLQLVLLILAELRRRIDSGVLRAVIWSAYMLADSTAIYTLGHLSVTSRSDDHELMSLWAPFLLLHLGGQDNITAYAIEDNRLWLRNLQAFVLQVAAATYVLYESTVVGTQALLRNTAILMLVVGVIKYGERVWALKCANTRASFNKYRDIDGTVSCLENCITMDLKAANTDDLLRIAHLMLDAPKNLLMGPLPEVVVRMSKSQIFNPTELYKVVEMQLSLMHDVVYTKAEVIHTWYGLCIHIISPVCTIMAFVLVHMSGLSVGDHQYSRADVAITYLLLGGAVILEMVSVLKVIFSRWSTVLLERRKERCIWRSLAKAITSIRRFVIPERVDSKWWWSNSMGQHNLFDLCVYSRASQVSRIARWMGVEVCWNTMVNSKSIPVSTTIKKLLEDQMLKTSESPHNNVSSYQYKSIEEEPNHIVNSRGRTIFMDWWVDNKEKDRYLSMEFDESILVWHIATNIYLLHSRCKNVVAHDKDLAEAIRAISNYMLFLLAARPYMLPGSVSRTRYVGMCYCLTRLELGKEKGFPEKLFIEPYSGPENKTLLTAHKLAHELVRQNSDHPIELNKLLQVWTEMLCYAGYRCSGYSHVKQLSNGGELLTVAALVVDYGRRHIRWESIPLVSAA